MVVTAHYGRVAALRVHGQRYTGGMCLPNMLYAADPVAALESAGLQRCDGTSTEHWFGVDYCSIWMLAWWSRLSVQLEGYTAGQGDAREVK